MQVQHHIGIAGMLHQQATQAVELRGRRWQVGEGIAHGAADQGDVGVSIVAQLTFQSLRHVIGEFREIAIEILPAGELEATLMGGLEHLRDSDRIGHGHQLDHCAQAPLLFQRLQAALEFDGDAHPRQLVGMQGGLDVGLARPAAKTEQRQLALRARGTPRQEVLNVLHKTP
ncbi:hypothetical protein D3C76_1300200 [compost metagenome]